MDKVEEKLLPIPEVLIDDQMRFWGHVKRLGPDDCWEWQSHKIAFGHGTFSIKGWKYYAHRVSYYLTYGEPGKIRVLHECNNPSCVNPRHLYKGTHSQNMKQCFIDGRHPNSTGGDTHNKAVFYNQDAVKIRLRHQNGESQRMIAKSLGVTHRTISDIVNFKTYQYV